MPVNFQKLYRGSFMAMGVNYKWLNIICPAEINSTYQLHSWMYCLMQNSAFDSRNSISHPQVYQFFRYAIGQCSVGLTSRSIKICTTECPCLLFICYGSHYQHFKQQTESKILKTFSTFTKASFMTDDLMSAIKLSGLSRHCH